MEFKFDVRSILIEDITKVDNTLIIKGWNSKTRFRVEYQQLYELVNAIGEASSFAQGLSNVITTSEKLQNSDHLLYLMKEDDPTSRVSMVVGMLKIGRKKLFLLDNQQQTKEVAPLCILDFYVHESRQRRGYGRRLFEFMLRDQGVMAGHMAIDKPSDKLLGFLKKHYSLVSQVPQINNFVIYSAFFQDRPISLDEQQMTAVSRSRGGSRQGSCANSQTGSRTGSRTVSPEIPSTPNATSPSAGRRQSGNVTPSSSPAGRPSYGPRHSSIYQNNGIQFATFHPTYSSTISPSSPRLPNTEDQYRLQQEADILHGRADRHTPAAHKNPRYQPTLEWMRTEPGEGSYYSRTPSNTVSPLTRTPITASPPGTPPKGVMIRPDPVQAAKEVLETSIAPTPATSPNGGTTPNPNTEELEDEKSQNGDKEENEEEEEKNEDEVDKLAEELESGMITPPELGKKGGWRDSISRNSEGLIKHLSATNNEGTSVGVLKDDGNVHGQLKFHHHKLW